MTQKLYPLALAILIYLSPPAAAFDRDLYENNDGGYHEGHQYYTEPVNYFPDFAEPPEIEGLFNKAKAAMMGEKKYWEAELKKIQQEITNLEKFEKETIDSFNESARVHKEVTKTISSARKDFPLLQQSRAESVAEKLRERADLIEEAEAVAWVLSNNRKEINRLKEERDEILLFLPNLQ
jgi:hypothetical protein